MMRIMQCASIADAHEKAIRHILEKGNVIITEDGEVTAETDPITLVIQRPLNDPKIHECSSYREMYSEQYAKDLWEGTTAEFDYDYNKLLRHYETGNPLGEKAVVYTDQIQAMIDRLRDEPISRRACATTWRPAEHCDSGYRNPPCLQHIQGWVRNSMFNMRVVYRSNDILGAAGVNMYGNIQMQNRIAGKIGVAVGTYHHDATIPHIYLKKNLSEVVRWRDECKIRPNDDIAAQIDRLQKEVSI